MGVIREEDALLEDDIISYKSQGMKREKSESHRQTSVGGSHKKSEKKNTARKKA